MQNLPPVNTVRDGLANPQGDQTLASSSVEQCEGPHLTKSVATTTQQVVGHDLEGQSSTLTASAPGVSKKKKKGKKK